MTNRTSMCRSVLICYVLLAPLAVLLVSVSNDAAEPWYWWIAAVLVHVFVLSLVVAAVCLVTGLILSAVHPGSGTSETLIRFGATLGTVFFGLGEIFDQSGDYGVDL